MPEINVYYLESPTLSNLNRIFNSGDIPFIRLSKFFESTPEESEAKLTRQEKIGYYKRQEGSAILTDFWKSSAFTKFLEEATGLKPKLREANHLCYSAGDYSLLHAEESESRRLTVAYDFTKTWEQDWGGYDIYTSPDKNPLICNRDPGSLMIVKLEKADLSCTRYVSQTSVSMAQLDKMVYDIA